MCVAIRIFRNSLRSPPWSHHGTCPLLPTSPRYFATFDFIRPVRAVTVNFMDRSRSRQAHQEVGRSGVENEDEPRRSSSVFQFSLFFLNRRNGKSPPIFLSFSRLAKEASCQRCCNPPIFHRGILFDRAPPAGFLPVESSGLWSDSLDIIPRKKPSFEELQSCFRRNSIDCFFSFFFFNSDFVRLGRKLHGWIVGRIQ